MSVLLCGVDIPCKNLKISKDKVIMNLDRYENTSAASIPIALCEALAEGRIQDGDNIVLVGFGAGLSWAAAVRMGGPETIPQLVSWQFVPLKDEAMATLKSVLKAAGVALTVILGALSIPFFSSGRGRK